VRVDRRRLASGIVVAAMVVVAVLFAWPSAPPTGKPAEVGRRPPEPVAPPPALVPSPPPPAPPSAMEPEPPPPMATPPPPTEIRVAYLFRDVVGDAPVARTTVKASWEVFERVEQSFRMSRHDVSATTDEAGRATFVIPGATRWGFSGFDAGPTWQVVRVVPPGAKTSPAPGAPRAEAPPPPPPDPDVPTVVYLCKAFRLKGRTFDAQGRPLPDVQVSYGVRMPHETAVSLGNVMARTDADGAFDLGPFPEDPTAPFGKAPEPWLASMMKVTFHQDGFATTRIDPAAVPKEERDDLRVWLSPGVVVSGVLVDDRGRPLPDAVVAIEYGAEYDLRRGTRTDAQGRFRIDRVAPGKPTLLARAFDHDAKAKRELVVERADLDLKVVAETIRLSHPPRTTRLFGIDLADVDDEMRAAYDLPEHVHVMVFATGDEPDRWGIGRLAKGYGIWIVGEEAATSVKDAVERMLRPPNTSNDSMEGSKRVVYTFWDEDMSGTNTQYVRLGPGMREELEALRDRLSK
jgi:hypothetical protein